MGFDATAREWAKRALVKLRFLNPTGNDPATHFDGAWIQNTAEDTGSSGRMYLSSSSSMGRSGYIEGINLDGGGSNAHALAFGVSAASASPTEVLRLKTNGITADVDVSVPDEAYGVGWNGSLEVPTKNAVYDKIESLGGGGGGVTTISFASTGLTPSTATSGAVTVAGTLTTTNGGTGTSTTFTPGSVVFAGISGNYAENSSSLFYDSTNKFLGIGNGAPSVRLHVSGTASLTNYANAWFRNISADTGSSARMYLSSSDTIDRSVYVEGINTNATNNSHALAIGASAGSAAPTEVIRFGPGSILSAVPLKVPDEAYGVAWNGSVEVPTKNAVYDKIEAMGGVSTLSFGTTGLTPSAATSGAITVSGTLVVGNGGTGATTLSSNKLVVGNGASAVTASIISDNGTDININVVGESQKLVVDNGGTNIDNASVVTNARGTIHMANTGSAQALGNLGSGLSFSGTGTTRRRALIAAYQTTAGTGTAAAATGLKFYTYDGTTVAQDGVAEKLSISAAGITASVNVAVPDEVYGVSWNGSTDVPTKNAVYDKIQTLGSGTVTSVSGSGGTTGLTLTGGPITTSGTLTLGGTLGVANGGTGAATLTSGQLLKGNGTSAVSSSIIYDNGTSVTIGTTGLTQLLSLDNDALIDNTAAASSGHTKASLALSNSGTVAADGALGNAISFSGVNTNRRKAMIASYQDGTAGGQATGFKFYTYGGTTAATDAVTLQMTLTSGGNLGIGNTPATTLDVTGDAAVRGDIFYQLAAPASKAAAATLTAAEVLGNHVQYTGASATLTLPTGTNLDAALPAALGTNMAFDFTIINTGAGTCTLAVNTGITAVGTLTVATLTAASWRIRRTAANTFIVYRT